MWHKGTIAEAIGKTKKDQTILMVFVEGQDEKSEQMRRIFGDESVQLHCDNANFVCLKIKFESESYKQFAQIYPCPSVPIIFFIGLGGKPVEILVGSCEIDEFIGRCNKAIELHMKQIQEQTAAAPNLISQTKMDDGPSSQPLDDRVQRAQDAIAKLRAEKLAAEIEEEKEKERRRRDEGKGLKKVQDLANEKEMQEIVGHRKKTKKRRQRGAAADSRPN